MVYSEKAKNLNAIGKIYSLLSIPAVMVEGGGGVAEIFVKHG
jgi:riboflavin biosynthesis pyrimidine reductase